MGSLHRRERWKEFRKLCISQQVASGMAMDFFAVAVLPKNLISWLQGTLGGENHNVKGSPLLVGREVEKLFDRLRHVDQLGCGGAVDKRAGTYYNNTHVHIRLSCRRPYTRACLCVLRVCSTCCWIAWNDKLAYTQAKCYRHLITHLRTLNLSDTAKMYHNDQPREDPHCAEYSDG